MCVVRFGILMANSCFNPHNFFQVLSWRLNHHSVTVNTWINVYTQLSSHHLRPPGVKAKEFEYPAYSGMEFIKVMQVGVKARG